MKTTDLLVIGTDGWGQKRSRKLYRDDSGRLFVAIRKPGSLRRKMVPYKSFAGRQMTDSYIMEASIA